VVREFSPEMCNDCSSTPKFGARGKGVLYFYEIKVEIRSMGGKIANLNRCHTTST